MKPKLGKFSKKVELKLSEQMALLHPTGKWSNTIRNEDLLGTTYKERILIHIRRKT